MVSERQDQAMEDGINMDGISMEVMEENWRKTDKLLQQFITSTRKTFQDTAKRAESDRRFYNNLNEIRVHLGMPPIDYLCDSIGSGSTTVTNHDEVAEAGLGLEKSARVEGQDLQVSVTGGSDQGRIPNPRTGNAGADDLKHLHSQPTVLPTDSQAPRNDVSPKIEGAGDPTIFWGINIERPTLFKDFRTELDVGAPSQKLLVESKEHQEVISIPLDVSVAVELDRMDELAMVRWADRGMISVEFLGNSIAHDLFVEMPKKGFLVLASVEGKICMGKQRVLDGNLIFDPGIVAYCMEVGSSMSLINDDVMTLLSNTKDVVPPHCLESSMQDSVILTYDRGEPDAEIRCRIATLVRNNGLILVFDPGIPNQISYCYSSMDSLECSHLELLVYWVLEIKSWCAQHSLASIGVEFVDSRIICKLCDGMLSNCCEMCNLICVASDVEAKHKELQMGATWYDIKDTL